MNKIVAVSAAAAVPVCSPALTPAEAGQTDDPIFAAIDAYRRADAACVSAPAGDIPDDLDDRWSETYHVVLQTRPTTPAGLAALTTWARERTNWLHAQDSGWLTEHLCTLFSTLDDAARGMSGLQPWSPSAVIPTENDQELVEALEGMFVADLAIDRLHKAYGDDADGRDDYATLDVQRNEYIATLITVPAASSVGIRAKAKALQAPRFIEDWDQHQQVAVSLADDIAGSCLVPDLSYRSPAKAAADSDMGALIAKFERMLDEYYARRSDWAPRLARAHAETDERFGEFFRKACDRYSVREASEKMHDVGEAMKPLAREIVALPTTFVQALRAKAMVAFWKIAPLAAGDSNFHFGDEYPFMMLFSAVAEFCGLTEKVASTGYRLPPLSDLFDAYQDDDEEEADEEEMIEA